MLRGKTALITGSTSGIGLGIAERLVRSGADLVINGFGSACEIEQLRSRLASTRVKVVFSPADMSKSDTIAAMAIQVGLCGRQTWRCRADQDRRAGGCRARHHRQRRLPRLCADAVGGKANS